MEKMKRSAYAGNAYGYEDLGREPMRYSELTHQRRVGSAKRAHGRHRLDEGDEES